MAETRGGRDIRRATQWQISYAGMPEHFCPFENSKYLVFILCTKQISKNPLSSQCIMMERKSWILITWTYW